MVAFLWLNEMNERKQKHFSLQQSVEMSVEVWDHASVQNHVLQVENQFFNLALSQQEVLTTAIRILRIYYWLKLKMLREGLQWKEKR